MTTQRKYNIIISGGGTGGHVFPAIAIGNSLNKLYPGCELLFVGAKGKLEMEKVPAAGYKIEGLWISGFQRKLSLKNLVFPFKVLFSLLKSIRIIRKFKPDAAIGVGGYASGPLLFMAARKGIPVMIQEQNSYPGITNKILASKASKICVAYDGMDRFFDQRKILKTGNPVRADITNIMLDKQEAVRTFDLDAEKTLVLVLGGSLGARTINESIAAGLDQLTENNMQLIWQCGKLYMPAYQHLIQQYKKNVRIRSFISEMNLAYASADIIVARAGALTISELCLLAKPVILVPSPNVAEDHQTKNAMSLVDFDAALLVEDGSAKKDLTNAIIDLNNNRELQLKLSANIRKMALPDAADDIANELIKMIEKYQNQDQNILIG